MSQAVRVIHEANPSWTSYEIANILGVSPTYVAAIGRQDDIPLPKRKRGPKNGAQRGSYMGRGVMRKLITIHNGRACYTENAIDD